MRRGTRCVVWGTALHRNSAAYCHPHQAQAHKSRGTAGRSVGNLAKGPSGWALLRGNCHRVQSGGSIAQDGILPQVDRRILTST
jgi:hypothetical protein